MSNKMSKTVILLKNLPDEIILHIASFMHPSHHIQIEVNTFCDKTMFGTDFVEYATSVINHYYRIFVRKSIELYGDEYLKFIEKIFKKICAALQLERRMIFEYKLNSNTKIIKKQRTFDSYFLNGCDRRNVFYVDKSGKTVVEYNVIDDYEFDLPIIFENLEEIYVENERIIEDLTDSDNYAVERRKSKSLYKAIRAMLADFFSS